ncbi:MAG: IPT/TIG domain-containing protein, partial [Deltaproteobacteria bacterium]|nr:IPT/TIG domain-containing protein [Deltaproteobacteria bacterium]
MRNVTLFVTLLALAGCQEVTRFEPYYADRSDPEVTGVDPAFEEGNGGGNLVTIAGSGFGDDADDLVVQFGRHNAPIVSVSDSAIEVVTPTGPMTGGPVDILVATPTGYIECIPPGTSGYDSGCEVDYTYDVGALSGEPDFYTGQEHFVLIHNLWYSCYGGMYDNPEIGGCDTIAYFGQTGLDGIGEFYRFSYPRVHAASQGFVSGTDFNPEMWRVVEQFDQPF